MILERLTSHVGKVFGLENSSGSFSLFFLPFLFLFFEIVYM